MAEGEEMNGRELLDKVLDYLDTNHLIDRRDMLPEHKAKLQDIMEGHESRPTLLGVRFKCVRGHEWESAVGGVWLQMPTCPECHPKMQTPACAWIGKWK